MDSINRLAQLFAQFPGIGGRQSKRFVYFLLKQPKAYINELASLILALEDAVSECRRCHRFYVNTDDGERICKICADPLRDHRMLLVVERDADLEAVEQSGTYSGMYFVLGGSLPILEKDPAAKIRIKELLALLTEDSSGIEEVILACAMNPEGDHTAEYVRNAISMAGKRSGITVTSLGRGLSTGTELEYSDAETLRWAIEGRR